MKKIDLGQIIVILALVSSGLIAQEPNFVLGETYVYGTERLDPASIRNEFISEFERIVAMVSTNEHEEGEAISQRISEELRSRGPFSYLTMGYGWSGPDSGIAITIDVVEEADEARRMPFRPAPTGEFARPEELFELWEEYEEIVFRLMMSGSLSPFSECPVLHCLASFEHPDLKPYLATFNAGARDNEDLLYEISEGAQSGRDRELAIVLLAHTNNAERMLPMLGRAIYDPEGGVRNYAMRVMIGLALKDPEMDYPVENLVVALDFPETTDRNKSAYTLLNLVGVPRHREVIRSEALPTLSRLLRMGAEINHEPAYEILKELSGEDFDARNYDAWQNWVRREQTAEVQ